jgi:undecaprenyl-diphosphatase
MRENLSATNDKPSGLRARLAAVPVEAEVLLALALITGCLLIFAAVAGAIGGGGRLAFDETVLMALRTPGAPDDPPGPRWFEELVRDITALGSTGVLTLLVLGVGGFQALTGRVSTALAVIGWSAAGTLVSHISKLGFARPRPELVPHVTEVFTLSFPSGHAMLSAVIYLTLGALIANTQPARRVKSYVMGVAVLLTLLVGASRVYLGVHWPSDVLAGWALGAAWACIGWLLLRRVTLQQDRPI